MHININFEKHNIRHIVILFKIFDVFDILIFFNVININMLNK